MGSRKMSDEFVASVSLTLILKSDGGICHIMSGFQVSMKGVDKYMTQYLNDFQFGVGVSFGVKAIFTMPIRY